MKHVAGEFRVYWPATVFCLSRQRWKRPLLSERRRPTAGRESPGRKKGIGPVTEKRFTPREISESYSVTVDVVLAWIKSGQLRAVDVSRAAGGKPRWRIDPADLAAFEARRSSVPLPKPARRRRRSDRPVKRYV